jgi:hypothetical protein
VRLARGVVPSALLATLVVSAGVRAQGTPPRPYQGLFGSGGEVAGLERQSFDLTVSGFGGYESNVPLAQSQGLFAPSAPLPGFGDGAATPNQASRVLGMSATLGYARRWKKASFDTYGSATSTDYRAIPGAGAQTGYSGGVGLSVPLSRRLSLVANTSLSWRPFYELTGVFPGLPPLDDLNVPVSTPTSEFGLVPASAFRQLSEVRLTRGLSRRSRLDVYYTRVATHFDDPGFSTYDSSDSRVGADYNHILSRYLSLRLGYGYRIGQLGNRDDQRYRSHELNAGLDYHRGFNLWHRTTFSFSTGSTVFANQPLQIIRGPVGQLTSVGLVNAGAVTSPTLHTESLLASGDPAGPDIRVILTGTGTLVWEFLRSWAARAQVIRGVNYLEGFAAPAVTNSVSAGIGGLVTRRVQVDGGASYSSGTIGTTKVNDNGYGSWNAYASADYAMSRHLAFYGHYFYYDYGFQQGVILPAGLSNNFKRYGVRFGVKAWVPLCRCH